MAPQQFTGIGRLSNEDFVPHLWLVSL